MMFHPLRTCFIIAFLHCLRQVNCGILIKNFDDNPDNFQHFPGSLIHDDHYLNYEEYDTPKCEDLIVKRQTWGALPPRHVTKAVRPVPVVIVAHTATRPCTTMEECAVQVRAIQRDHRNSRGWDDIGYNFLIGGDGSVFEGRGWQVIGAHSRNWNNGTLGISFMGNFRETEPSPDQLKSAQKLLECGVRIGEINSKYRLLAHSQVVATHSPGRVLYEILQRSSHWSKTVCLCPHTEPL